jgi:aminoglycoside phosphotransferase (APT) family kinase protein
LTEEFILERLNNIYGDFKPVWLAGGYTNQTVLLQGTEPPLVVKVSVSNQDMQNEMNSLKITKGTSVPKIYDLINLENHQLIVMEYRPGANGQSILDQGNLEKAKELYKKLGQSLAKDVHSIKFKPSSGINECNMHNLQLELPYLPEDLINVSKEILRGLNDYKEDWVLTHGDFGPHNVLFGGANQFTILDWEWSEWGNPLCDLSWTCWFTALHYPENKDTLIPLFLESYLSINSIQLSAKKLKAYSVYKVWKVLAKIESASKEVKEEWIRRLKWTIETDIFL